MIETKRRSSATRRLRFAWRTYDPRQLRAMDRQLHRDASPCCPCCGDPLEARPETRMARYLPLDATGYDLECRHCRRFRCIVRHTARSLRLVRMRRLVAAIRAIGTESRETGREPSPA